MGGRTKIEWSEYTWNPIRARNKATGGVGHFCEKVSAGCKHCYAERMQPRFKNPIAYGPQSLEQVEVFLDDEVLLQPLRWKRPRMIFLGSMTDLFGHWVPFEWLDRIWAVMALCPQHTFQVVTKRPERMAEYLNGSGIRRRECYAATSDGTTDPQDEFGRPYLVMYESEMLGWKGTAFQWPLPHVWLLTSVEDQRTADERIPHLLRCPAEVRGLSVEPLLGAVELKAFLPHSFSREDSGYDEQGNLVVSPCSTCGKTHADEHLLFAESKLHWVIVGGESGPKARPMHPDWVRSLRDQCHAAGVEFFFKQVGEWGWAMDANGRADGPAAVKMGKRAAGRLLDGVEHNGMPR